VLVQKSLKNRNNTVCFLVEKQKYMADLESDALDADDFVLRPDTDEDAILPCSIEELHVYLSKLPLGWYRW
jgi:hypothetical protein